jgi:hypothetical protein
MCMFTQSDTHRRSFSPTIQHLPPVQMPSRPPPHTHTPPFFPLPALYLPQGRALGTYKDTIYNIPWNIPWKMEIFYGDILMVVKAGAAPVVLVSLEPVAAGREGTERHTYR